MMKINFGILFLALLAMTTACAKTETRLAVTNSIGNTSGIKVRNSSNDSSSEMDFGQVANGTTTSCKSVTYSSLTININATDNAQNGSVTLKEAENNVVTVYKDGTNPTVSQSTTACK